MADDTKIPGIIPLVKREVVLLLEAGYLCMELNKYDEAEEIFVGVSAMIPHSDVPHTALGNLYFSQGHFTPALKAHQKAIELNAESAAAYAGAAEALFFLKKIPEAMSAADKAIELDPEGPAGQFARSLKEARSLGIFSA